ncbi:MAG TPA: hypothetical protein VK590_14075 [Saprospiraceae bacterium]|nr:hypothetical protein [Saprospiraceae bacterium]
MKKNTIKTAFKIIGFVSFLFMFSCHKDKPVDPTPIDQNEINQCYYSKSWDSLQVKNAILGVWNWEYIWCELGGNNTQYKGMSIELKADNSINVKQNGQIVQSSKWKINKLDETHYGIYPDPGIDQMQGNFIICSDVIGFNLGYVDGCANYFRKIK